MTKSERGGVRGDVFGGLTAAVIALPLALAFGVAAFAPLGPEHAATGALVGLLGSIFTGFFASWFGGTPTQITGPTAPMTVVVTSFLAESVKRHGTDEVGLALLMMAMAITLGGVGQIALGLSGGGKVVKFIPYPVVAGFMNGIAVLIFMGQLKPFFGVQGDWSSFDRGQALVPVAVGIATMVALVVTKRLSKTIPASLVALLVGIASYLGLAAGGYAAMSSQDNALLVGTIPSPFSSLAQLQALLPVFRLDTLGRVTLQDVQAIATTAGALAVLGSIDSLLTSVVADQKTGVRHDARRELVGQGIGNIVSGALGGLAGAGATVRTLVNIDAGGRTRRAGMLHAAGILVVVAFLGQPAGWIPKAALSGILFVTAVGMLDQYSLGLIRKNLVRRELAIIIVVTLITVAVDLMVAVGVGVAIAGALFVREQTRKPAIRRKLRGHEVSSRRVRPAREMEVLERHGERTLAYELNGSLFFGTTDQLVTSIEEDLAETDRFLFDFAKVEDMDLSGVRVLVAVFERLAAQGRVVSVSGLSDLERRSPRVRRLIAQLGVLATVTEEHRHPTLDHGLERYEDELLAEHLPSEAVEGIVPLASCDGLAHLSEQELATLEDRACRTLEAQDGERLIERGSPCQALWIVRGGRVSVMGGVDDEVRIASLGEGSLWGLRALLEDERWTTSLRADGAVTCTLIDREALDQLRMDHPEVVAQLERAVIGSALDRLELLTREFAYLEEA